MADLRRLLGLLRTGEDDAPTAAPPPGLDRLPELAALPQRAGLTVDLRVDGDLPRRPAGRAGRHRATGSSRRR